MNTVTDCKSTKIIEEYEIKSFEVNSKSEIKPFVLMQHLEDAAYIHAEKYGFGYSDTYPNGYGWFVTKYHIKFDRLPKAWESIKISTWPCLSKGVQCRRDFEVFNDSDERIGSIASSWALIDLEAKRIVNPFKTLNFPELYEEYTMETNFPKIEAVTDVDYEKKFEIRFDDIDLNNHVNNANYVAWATETMPYEFLNQNSIREMEIYYKKEATYGVTILSQVQMFEDKISVHSLKDDDTAEELALIKIYWDSN